MSRTCRSLRMRKSTNLSPVLLVLTMTVFTDSGPSTSTYVQRINAEQAAIKRRLVELGVDDIQEMLHETNLNADEQMNVDNASSSQPRPIGAKQRALAKFVRAMLGC